MKQLIGGRNDELTSSDVTAGAGRVARTWRLEADAVARDLVLGTSIACSAPAPHPSTRPRTSAAATARGTCVLHLSLSIYCCCSGEPRRADRLPTPILKEPCLANRVCCCDSAAAAPTGAGPPSRVLYTSLIGVRIVMSFRVLAVPVERRLVAVSSPPNRLFSERADSLAGARLGRGAGTC